MLRKILFSGVLILLSLFSYGKASAITISTVFDATSFQAALDNAGVNFDDDVIMLEAGNYDTEDGFLYHSDFPDALTIQGVGTSTTFIRNTGGGDALKIEAGERVEVSQITFREASGGAGLWIESDDNGGTFSINIHDNHFEQNQRGLVIINTNLLGNATIENNMFLDNFADSGNGSGFYIYGVVLGVPFPVNLTGNTFRGNYAAGDGGAAYMAMVTGDSDMTLTENIFENNIAGDEGGALYIAASGTNTDIIVGSEDEGNTFTGNEANGSGGAVYARSFGDSENISILGNEFSSNASGNEGGGFLADIDGGSSLLTVAYNTLGTEGAGNSADVGGGAKVYALHGLEMHDNTIAYNNARRGGGVMIQTDGAGANIESHNVYKNNFHDNTAGERGGGLDIYSQMAGTLSVKGNQFIQNVSEGGTAGGAGLVLAQIGDQARVVNNIFDENSALIQGGGFEFYTEDAGAGIDFLHNTVINNSAAGGGGAYFGFNDAVGANYIFNNIFWDNGEAQGGDVGINLEAWSEVNFKYNRVGSVPEAFCLTGDTATCSPTNGITTNYFQSNVITSDPLINVGVSYEPGVTSLVINAGFAFDNLPADDYAGEDRIYGTAPDLGAYELQEDPPVEEEDSPAEERRSQSTGSKAKKKVKDTPPVVEKDDVPLLPPRDLLFGSSGADVKALQQILISLGFNIPAGPTGWFGLQTKTALIAFQQKNSIAPAVGYCGPKTRALLEKINSPGIWWK